MSKEEIERETEGNLRRRINKTSLESYMKLMHWLYLHHRDVLREYEKTLGNMRVEFA